MPPHNEKTAGAEEKREPDGVIRFEVENTSSLVEMEERTSPDVEVRGIPWSVFVWQDEDLNVSLQCKNSQLSKWLVNVTAEHIIVHSDTTKNLIEKRSKTITDPDEFTVATMKEWEEFINYNKGFMINGSITVEVRFWITDMKGIKSFPRFNFTDPNNFCHDVALMIEGEKIYVSKQILAVQSPVFNSMFYGGFAEKNKEEIELKDVNRQKFLEMLHIIYPSSCKKITDESVEFLLKLGDRFQIESLIDRAEKFIEESEFFDTTEKLRIADKYRLFGLMEHCLYTFKTTDEFKDLQELPLFINLSEAAVRLLFNRLTMIAK